MSKEKENYRLLMTPKSFCDDELLSPAGGQGAGEKWNVEISAAISLWSVGVSVSLSCCLHHQPSHCRRPIVGSGIQRLLIIQKFSSCF